MLSLAEKPFRFMLCFILCVWAAIAQDPRGTVLGRVTDPSGAAVAGATVKITNEATGVTVPGASNADGNFEIPFLTPGSYRMEAGATGFKAYVRRGVLLRVRNVCGWTFHSSWAPSQKR